jgi:hypothetical protein
MTEDAAAPTRRSRRRRFWLLILVLTLGLLLARAGLDLWAEHGVDQEVARLEKRYGSLAESTLRLPPVPAADNRARVVRAAAALTILENGSQEQRALGRFLASRTKLQVPSEVRAFAGANRAAIRVAEESRLRRQSNWEADYVSERGGMPPLMELRTLSNAIYVSSLIDLEEGRPDGAEQTIGVGLAVASTLREEPSLIAQLIRIAVATVHVQALQQLLVQAEPSKAALEDVARWLALNQTPDPIQVGLLADLKRVHAMMTRLERGQVEYLSGVTGDPPSWFASPLARLGGSLIRLAHVRYLQQMGALLDLQAGPRPRPEFASVVTPSRWSWVRRWDSMFTEGLVRAIEAGDLFTSELDAAGLAVALRRFRLDQGAYPDELSALVPGYLTSVPIDPFTGRPPVYTQKGAGFELHTEGPKNRTPRPPALDWVVTK